MRTRLVSSLAPAVAAGILLGACAQQVGDIDRTQPDVLRKSDFTDGEWYVRQTITDVPATTSTSFVGYTLATDKVRFVINADSLVAHRSYELNPGSSDRGTVAGGDLVDSGVVDDRRGTQDGAYYGEPVIAYSVTDHFDVQRAYNPQTGEEANVIDEDRDDRVWYEREYLRVNWSAVDVTGWQMLGSNLGTGFVEYVAEGEDGEDSIRFEYDEEGRLVYFDFVSRAYIEPSLDGCYNLIYQLGLGDCAAQQIEFRTSFRRAPSVDEDDYEPVTYDDRAMDRFGYFRTERLTYDRQRGTTVDGRLLFANRHDIWEDSWQRGEDGRPLRDEHGKRIALPFAERAPTPIVYHLSPHFPEPLLEYAAATAQGWDRSFRRAVAAAQSDGDVSGWEDVRPMFVLCQNPVTDTPVYPADPAYAADCGAVGDEARIGDLRYNVMYWVNNPQMSGPLGYGPSAPDPETGEILSGTAYVYGAGVDTYAQLAVDTIMFANGDLEPGDLQSAEYVRDMIRERRDPAFDPRGRGVATNPRLASMPIPDDATSLLQGLARERVDLVRQDALDGRLDTLRSGVGWTERRIRAIEESGLDMLGMNDELLLAARPSFDQDGRQLDPLDPAAALGDDELERARVTRWMREFAPETMRQRQYQASIECVYGANNLDDSILGIAEHYRGRTDYEAIYQEVRGLIFKAVMEHEIGHTLGLRHNFGASWDSLNYFDEFWEAKLEGYPAVDESGETIVKPFGTPETMADLYGIASLTPAQVTARMREFQYSSIMDYSSAFNTDFGGVGKYDDAAILFAYTTGVDRTLGLDPDHADYNTQEMGFVEVWPNLPSEARDILQGFETTQGIGYYHPLELYHYATIVGAMGDTPDEIAAALVDRDYVRLPDLEAMIANESPGRPVEVPYIFCSDEYRGTRQTCHTWDRGADPMEQTIDYIDRYRRYYYFDNYRRERLGWNTGSAAERAYSRIFAPLVQGYQRWLLSVAFTTLPDPALENQWTFAAFAGLNLVAEAVTTPSSGYYYRDEDDVYRLYTSQIDLSVFDEATQAQIRRDTEFVVPEGLGRPKWSDYDADTGYYYYQFPDSSGHYLTSIFAMLALTSAEVSVVGVELGQFEQTYVIPPYLVFEDELTQLFNGVVLQDPGVLGLVANPVSDGFDFEVRPMLTVGFNDGSKMNPETGGTVRDGLELLAGSLDPAVGYPVDPRPSFSEQIYALIWGMSGFTSNYSARYIDQGRVWELTAGETPTLSEGFELTQFCDPNPAGTGKCYAALAPLDADALPLGAGFVARGQALVAEYEAAVERGSTSAANDALNAISNLVTDINILSSVSESFRTVF